MLKNYFEIDENTEVSSFLKNLDDKKNTHYIILKGGNNFVDVRTIALMSKKLNEKLKNLKKSLPKCLNCSEEDKFRHLIKSGVRVIKIGENEYYDFVDALKYVLDKKYSFLTDKLSNTARKQIFALNPDDKISGAKKLFVKNKINLLPVVNNEMEVIGELRPMDLLVGSLFIDNSNKSDYYNEKNDKSKLNLPIKNLMNKKPILLKTEMTYKEAIDILLNKRMSSLIVVENEKLYSILSYKDIFKFVLGVSKEEKYNIEYLGVSDLFEDDLELIKRLAEKQMKKIVSISDYEDLKIVFKSHGNLETSHNKKFSIKLTLSKGNSIIHVNKEILKGNSNEEMNEKKKTKWNIPLLVQESLKILNRKVIEEKDKK